MPVEQKVVVIAVATALVLAILELVRKRKLREEYSWLWLLAGSAVLGAALLPFDALMWIAGLMGSRYPPSALFFLGFCALIGLCLPVSVRLSRMTEQIKNLAQKVSLLEAELERRGGGEEEEPPPP